MSAWRHDLRSSSGALQDIVIRGDFSASYLDSFFFEGLRPGRPVCAAKPKDAFVAPKLLVALATRYDCDGAASATEAALTLLCPDKTTEVMRGASLTAPTLLEVCRRFPLRGSCAHGFVIMLELVWLDARGCLADLFFYVHPADVLRDDADAFHFVLRICGARLANYVGTVVRDLADLTQFCATREGASAMWHFALAGALPPPLVQALAAPHVFFHSLVCWGRSEATAAAAAGHWIVCLAPVVWYACLDAAAKARLSEDYRRAQGLGAPTPFLPAEPWRHAAE